MIQPDAELPALSTAALIEPEESAVGVSPITTSALEPSRDAAAIASEALPATSADRLPAKIEPLADAGPENVKLAAASDVTSDVPPTLPTIEVATPPADDVAASEPEREPVAKTRRAKKRTALRAYRTSNDLAGSRGKKSRRSRRPSRRSGRSRCSSRRGRRALSPTPSKKPSPRHTPIARSRHATRPDAHPRCSRSTGRAGGCHRRARLCLAVLAWRTDPRAALSSPARLCAHRRRAGRLGGVATRAADEAGERAGP